MSSSDESTTTAVDSNTAKEEEEDNVYKELTSHATHTHNSSGDNLGASCEFADSFACFDDDDDLVGSDESKDGESK